MYHNFYQLRENPFNVTADPDFFFDSSHHTMAISNLIYGIQQRKGILVITGEIGTGKTTLCRQLLRQSDQQTKYALVLNPKCSEVQLLQMIAHDLGIQTKSKNKFHLIESLNTFLLNELQLNRNVVVIIDEAQNLSVNQLEQVRLLSNLETEKEKLMQLVLVGQPELQQKLALPSLRQLRQRIAVYYHLLPLEKHDIKNYVNHRLSQAKLSTYNTPSVSFTDSAIDKIYQYTQGSPRIINMLCDRALLAGFVSETYTIDNVIIESCVKEILYCEHYL